MDCQKTRKRMSEYVDGMLRDEEATAVKKHLDECAECAEVYRSTTVIIEHMQQMESIEEPADFLEKVNARLDERFSLGRIIRRLFVPLHIKIPLEVAAAAAIIAVVVYLGGVKEPPQRQYQIPITESEELLRPVSRIEKSEEIAIQSSAPLEGEPEKRENEVKKSTADKKQESGLSDSKPDQPVADAPKPKGTDSKESALVENKSEKPVTDTPKSEGPEPREDAPAGKDADEKGTDPPKSNYFGGNVEKSTMATRGAKNGPGAEPPLKELIRSLGGKVIEAEYRSLEETEKIDRIPNLMIVEIPAKNFEKLIQELIRRGEIKEPPTEIKRKANDMIRVELFIQRSNPPQ